MIAPLKSPDEKNAIRSSVIHIDTESGMRGGERQVLALMKGLRERNVRQVLVTRRESELADWAEAEDFTVERLAHHATWDPRTWLETRRICRRHEAVVLHAHTGNAHTLAFKAAPVSNPPLPVVITRRVDFPVKSRPASRRKFHASNMWYIAISNGVRDVLMRGGVPGERITIVASGIDPDRFADTKGSKEWRCKWSINEPGPVFGMVGSYVDHKDPLNLIDASEHVVKELPEARIVLIGDGDLRAQIETRVSALSLEKNVILTGWQEDVGPLLKALDVFVMPSKLEGLCTSLLDALAAGIPSVACAAGGIPDIIRDGENGTLVPPMDAKALALAMIDLWKNEAKRQTFARMGRAFVQEQFTIERMVEGTWEVYERVLGNEK